MQQDRAEQFIKNPFGAGCVANSNKSNNLTLKPALLLGMLMLAIKPVVYRYVLGGVAETPKLAWETGWRLGQLSEFALLITFLAMQGSYVSDEIGYMIQVATLITFVGSSFIVVMNFPTPVAISDRLRRD